MSVSKKNAKMVCGACYVIHYLFVIIGWFCIGYHRNICVFSSGLLELATYVFFFVSWALFLCCISQKFVLVGIDMNSAAVLRDAIKKEMNSFRPNGILPLLSIGLVYFKG